MNKRQLEVEKAKLAAEARELNELKAIYQKAADDISKKIRISDGKINVLLQNFDDLDDKQKSILQSQIYQRKFQQSLKQQIDDFTTALVVGQYESINDYMRNCYEVGFIGAMYDLHGQGIPLVMPIDEDKVVRALRTNSKISKRLYTKLGEDVGVLKKRIASSLSRGIATADSYANIARNIANDSNVGFNRAMRIARTEGHRIQANSAFDAQLAAEDAGADIVKQWDAALDGKTRPHHRQLDGQIRELDEPFEVAGMTAMYPSGFGRASEDVNCRCALLQRARWALDEDELETLQDRAAYFGLDKTDSFNDFKKKYLKAADDIAEPTKTVVKPSTHDKTAKASSAVATPTNKYGNEITFDFTKAKNQERAEEGKQLITDLANEYDSYLTTVKIGASGAAGVVDNLTGEMKLSNFNPDTIIHEFGHALAASARKKYGYADDTELEFMKEVAKVRRAYRAELYGNPKKGIKDNPTIGISPYADKDIDEFLAESFTQAKMLEMGLKLPEQYGKDAKYSKQVLALIDKYFKKPVANVGESSKIKSIRKAASVPDDCYHLLKADTNFDNKNIDVGSLRAIDKAIETRKNVADDFRFDTIQVAKFVSDDKSVLITDYEVIGGKKIIHLYLNEKYLIGQTVQDLDEMCMKYYDNGWWKSKTFADLVNHEIMHARISENNSYEKAERLYETLKEDERVKGFCRLVDEQPDEFMNEMYVAICNGENIDPKYMAVYEEYAKEFLGE